MAENIFKIVENEAFKKVLSRSRGTSNHSVARTLSIKMSTLHGYKRYAKQQGHQPQPTILFTLDLVAVAHIPHLLVLPA